MSVWFTPLAASTEVQTTFKVTVSLTVHNISFQYEFMFPVDPSISMQHCVILVYIYTVSDFVIFLQVLLLENWYILEISLKILNMVWQLLVSHVAKPSEATLVKVE